jgi:GT2 family glycosyltransferase
MVYFIEDDVILEPNCLETLLRTFQELKAKGIKVGGVGPRTIEPPKRGRLMGLERYVAQKKRKDMQVPALIDKWTGLMYLNYGLKCEEVLETPLLPSWSLFSKEAVKRIGGYEEKAFNICNYSHEESDFFIRLQKEGYKLFFQPEAVAHHKHAQMGGTRVSPFKYYWAYFLGHLIFLGRNYGVKSLYMIPAFFLFIAYKLPLAILASFFLKVERG